MYPHSMSRQADSIFGYNYDNEQRHYLRTMLNQGQLTVESSILEFSTLIITYIIFNMTNILTNKAESDNH